MALAKKLRKYCLDLKRLRDKEIDKKAKKIYNEWLYRIYEVPCAKIITYESYTVFEDFVLNLVLDDKKYTERVREFMKRDGIEEYFKDGKYIGIKVYHKKP